MRPYFSQFGKIKKLRLSRNKKTGKSKHYAFIEFEDAAAAKAVTESMNNYLLFGSLLQVRLLPKERCHPLLFRGANHPFNPAEVAEGKREAYNQRILGQPAATKNLRLRERMRKSQETLKASGIGFSLLAESE